VCRPPKGINDPSIAQMSPGRIVFNYYRTIELREKLGISQHTVGGGWYKTTLDSYRGSQAASLTPWLHWALPSKLLLNPAKPVLSSPAGYVYPSPFQLSNHLIIKILSHTSCSAADSRSAKLTLTQRCGDEHRLSTLRLPSLG